MDMNAILVALSQPEAWMALLTLTMLEIVLGVDNIVFISILAGRLPAEQRDKARIIGIALAMVSRILLLLSITWIMRLDKTLFTVMSNEISGKDIILLLGGLFLIGKATHEIHNKLEGEEEHTKNGRGTATFGAVLAQILVIDLVFSIDSVITAVGMANQIWVMVTAVIISVMFMLAFSKAIADFVERHPTVKMLALAFLVLIGVNLIADGLGHHIPKGYTYFAMAFSVGVEMLNLKSKSSKRDPIHLRKTLPALVRKAPAVKERKGSLN